MTNTQLLLIGGAVAAGWYLMKQSKVPAGSPGSYAGSQAPNTPVYVGSTGQSPTSTVGSNIPFGPIGAPTGPASSNDPYGPTLPDGSLYTGGKDVIVSDPNGPVGPGGLPRVVVQ